jgi:hypothetical protein
VGRTARPHVHVLVPGARLEEPLGGQVGLVENRPIRRLVEEDVRLQKVLEKGVDACGSCKEAGQIRKF